MPILRRPLTSFAALTPSNESPPIHRRVAISERAFVVKGLSARNQGKSTAEADRQFPPDSNLGAARCLHRSSIARILLGSFALTGDADWDSNLDIFAGGAAALRKSAEHEAGKAALFGRRHLQQLPCSRASSVATCARCDGSDRAAAADNRRRELVSGARPSDGNQPLTNYFYSADEHVHLQPTFELRGRIEADATMAAQSAESQATIGDLQNGFGFAACAWGRKAALAIRQAG